MFEVSLQKTKLKHRSGWDGMASAKFMYLCVTVRRIKIKNAIKKFIFLLLARYFLFLGSISVNAENAKNIDSAENAISSATAPKTPQAPTQPKAPSEPKLGTDEEELVNSVNTSAENVPANKASVSSVPALVFQASLVGILLILNQQLIKQRINSVWDVMPMY